MPQDGDELFETYDDADRPLGLVPRDEVHRRGVWHKSVGVFLFDRDGGLVLQRRGAGKDVAPGMLDLSVAEHLTPGETFEQGALRGLSEELGVSGVTLTPYAGRFRYRLEQGTIRDFEILRLFHGRYSGPLRPDPVEVAEVRVISRAELTVALEKNPERYTPWFRQHVIDVDLLGMGWLDSLPPRG